jgi:hypothetical protein
MNKSYGPLDSHVARAGNPSAESSASHDDDDLRGDAIHDDDVHDDDGDIRDDDIRELLPYTTDDRTLVGLGPPSSRSPVVLPASPQASPRPQSEPPGPWGSDGADPLPPSLRPRKGGIWSAAVPLLVVFAGVTVFAVRGLRPASHPLVASATAGAEPAHDNTGLFVRLLNADVHVLLDGKDHGPPPVLLMDLTPGSHVLTIEGAGYVTYEQPVTLIADHVSTLDPALLKTDGTSRNPLETSNEPTPELTSVRALAKLSTASGSHAVVRGVRPEHVELEETPPNPYTAALETQGGLLAASSSPPAMVVIDGRPVGKSPRAVELPAGAHTVVFIHPELGRQSVTVNVTPGKTTSAAAEF